VRCQEIGIRWGAAMSMRVLGSAAYELGDYHAALLYFAQSLQESLELRLERFLMYSAYGLARVLDALDRPTQAAAFDTVAYHYCVMLLDETHFINFEELPPDRVAVVTERSKTIEPEAELERLLAELQPAKPAVMSGYAAEQPLISPLTERELEILARVSNGMSNREIAEELFLSTGTVKWYLSQVYNKLGVNSRTQAVARARELQILL
jgi:DNA-binding CsgD family transcriptional regulator